MPAPYVPRVLSSQAATFDLLPLNDVTLPQGAGALAEGLNAVCKTTSGPRCFSYNRSILGLPATGLAVTIPLGIRLDAAISSVVVLHGILGSVRAAFTVRVVRHGNASTRKGLLNGIEFNISCVVDSLQGFAFFAKMETGFYKGPQSLAFAVRLCFLFNAIVLTYFLDFRVRFSPH